MKKRLETIILIAFLCVFVCAIAMIITDNNAEIRFRIIVEKNGNKEYLSLHNRDGKLTVFLPGYADLSSVYFDISEKNDMFIDGVRITDDFDFSSLQLKREYSLHYRVNRKEHAYTLVFLKSGNVDAMYIETESGNMEYIHGKKRNSEAGKMRLYRVNGDIDYSGPIASISGRGNTTWDDQEKKPYNIDLADGVSLLEMSASKEWVLLANAKDASHLRNKIVYDFADEAGLPYSPKCEWVDLYLNGEYRGLYLLTEKNEVGSGRIDIENEESFLVSMERKGRMVTQNLPYIVTEAEQALRIRYPKNVTDGQKDSLAQKWQSIENAILSESGIDAITGKSWTDLIDLESWVKKYLVEEIFGNLDACSISQYFYLDAKHKNARVVAGPVWDFDLSMGLPWQTDILDFMLANRLDEKEGIQTPWFHALYHKEEFYNRMQDIFKEEFVPLLNKVVDEKLDTYANVISEAAKMDAVRWNNSDFDQEVEKIRTFLSRRIEFLTKYWIDGKKYHIIEAHCEGVSYAYYAVEDGGYIEELPVFESTSLRTFLGWCYENGEPFDCSRKITEDGRIYAKWSGAPSFFVMYGEYFMPLVVIGMVGAAILFVEICRLSKGRVNKRGK